MSEWRKFSPIVVEQDSEQDTQQMSWPTSRRSSPKEEIVEQTATVSTSMKQAVSISYSLKILCFYRNEKSITTLQDSRIGIILICRQSSFTIAPNNTVSP